MSDLISRQDAIDVFWKLNVEIRPSAINAILDMLNTLPSAQPEIIQCKDCKHREEKPIADGRYWCELHNDFYYYCSDAERRTDE